MLSVKEIQRESDVGEELWGMGLELANVETARVSTYLTFPEGGPVSPGGEFKEVVSVPKTFSLQQNYPNPFNPATKITMTLPSRSKWRISVYNIMGQNVTEFSGESEPREVNVVWDATEFASGVYFYRARAGTFSATRKMLLLK